MKFNKAIVYLHGVSSSIANLTLVRKNIFDCLRALDIPFEEYENEENGFLSLYEDFNKKNVLYIVCDSLVYHFCDSSPVIIISRSISWAQSTPKPNCIGRITQDQISTDWQELSAIICRKNPMRQFFDHKSAANILVYNEYHPKTTDEFFRNSMASASWARLASLEYHTQLFAYEEEGIPFVHKLLSAGMAQSNHPDDLIIILNRDICLTIEAIGILRAFMDSRNIDHCYSHRVNVEYKGHLDYKDIKNMPHDWGIDLFVFRPSSSAISELLKADLYIGRTDWDNYWASIVKNRLPYNISYHFPHTGEWKLDLDEKNIHNQRTIWNAGREYNKYDTVGFKGLGPIS